MNLSGSIKTKIEVVEGIVLSKAQINGKDKVFIVDSGAPTIILNTNVSEHDGKEKFEGVGGSGHQSKAQVDNFSWCNVSLKDFSAPAIDLSHIEKQINRSFCGLIGYEQLKDKAFMIDYDQNEMHLWSAFEPDIKDVKSTIEFELKAHIPLIKAHLAERELLFGLDTGAAANLIDINLREQLKGFVASIDTDDLIGADKHAQEVEKGHFPTILFGDSKFEHMQTVFSNIDHIVPVFGKIDGLIGYEFLKLEKMVINYQEKKIYILKD